MAVPTYGFPDFQLFEDDNSKILTSHTYDDTNATRRVQVSELHPAKTGQPVNQQKLSESGPFYLMKIYLHLKYFLCFCVCLCKWVGQ